MVNKVVIIGSGPAGLTAAIYTARAELSPLVIEGFIKGGQAGGQLMTTTEVENFPGFEKGIFGADLIMNMHKQAERFGARFVGGDIDSVDFSAKPFKLFKGEETIEAHAVIVAVGASARILEAKGVKEFWGKGISACATCDGALPIFRNQVIAVLGGGDAALEEAMFLTKFASKVLLIHRRNEFRAGKAMQKRVFENKKIEIIFDSVLEEAYGSSLLEGVKLKNTKTSQITNYPCKGLFMAVGHRPNTEFLGGSLETDQSGYIKIKGPGSSASVEGVFAAGDTADPRYRQAVYAAAMGCAAAIDAEKYLLANNI